MYQPFDIGKRFRIGPPGTEAPEDGRINLVMARGAFGSGEHETTASCLETLETLPELAGARLLDVGSGTAILAIGALLLGAAEAVAVDISPDAVASARRNCEANGVAERVRHLTGSLESVPGKNFDLIVANIYGDLLLDFADGMVRRVRPGGLLLLSGILWEYNFEVRQAFERRGCKVLKNRMLEQFSTVLLQKKE